MMDMDDAILLDIQELICPEAFAKISIYGAPKLKQQKYQCFSYNHKKYQEYINTDCKLVSWIPVQIPHRFLTLPI